MKVKKEVRVCDICSNEKQYEVAKGKCPICKKDVCASCMGSIDFVLKSSFFNINKKINMCHKCLMEVKVSVRKDGEFLRRITDEIKKHSKNKIMLRELEKQEDDN